MAKEETLCGRKIIPGNVKPFSYARVRVFVAAKRAFFVSASCPDVMKSDAEPEIKAFLESIRRRMTTRNTLHQSRRPRGS